jgi:hypothetical protein
MYYYDNKQCNIHMGVSITAVIITVHKKKARAGKRQQQGQQGRLLTMRAMVGVEQSQWQPGIASVSPG